jgi:hypothetical protein
MYASIFFAGAVGAVFVVAAAIGRKCRHVPPPLCQSLAEAVHHDGADNIVWVEIVIKDEEAAAGASLLQVYFQETVSPRQNLDNDCNNACEMSSFAGQLLFKSLRQVPLAKEA